MGIEPTPPQLHVVGTSYSVSAHTVNSTLELIQMSVCRVPLCSGLDLWVVIQCKYTDNDTCVHTHTHTHTGLKLLLVGRSGLVLCIHCVYTGQGLTYPPTTTWDQCVLLHHLAMMIVVRSSPPKSTNYKYVYILHVANIAWSCLAGQARLLTTAPQW